MVTQRVAELVDNFIIRQGRGEIPSKFTRNLSSGEKKELENLISNIQSGRVATGIQVARTKEEFGIPQDVPVRLEDIETLRQLARTRPELVETERQRIIEARRISPAISPALIRPTARELLPGEVTQIPGVQPPLITELEARRLEQQRRIKEEAERRLTPEEFDKLSLVQKGFVPLRKKPLKELTFEQRAGIFAPLLRPREIGEKFLITTEKISDPLIEGLPEGKFKDFLKKPVSPRVRDISVDILDSFLKFGAFSPFLTTGAVAKAKAKARPKTEQVQVKKISEKESKKLLKAVEEAFKKGKLKQKLVEVSNDIVKETNKELRKTKIQNFEEFLTGLKQKELIRGFVLDRNTGALAFFTKDGKLLKSATKLSPKFKQFLAEKIITDIDISISAKQKLVEEGVVKLSPKLQLIFDALLIQAPQIPKEAIAVTGALVSAIKPPTGKITEFGVPGRIPSLSKPTKTSEERAIDELKKQEKDMRNKIFKLSGGIATAKGETQLRSIEFQKDQLQKRLEKNLGRQALLGRQNLKSKQAQSRLQSSDQLILLKSQQTQIGDSLQKTSSLQSDLLKVASALALAQTSLQKQKLAQRLKQLQKLILRQKQLQKTKLAQQQRLKGKVTPKVKGKIAIPPVRLKSPDKIRVKKKPKKERGVFDVFVRRFGKDVKIRNDVPLTKAKRILKSRLSNTLRASGFVRDNFGRKVRTGLSKEKGFRPSKRDPFRVVEIRSKRLNTASETKAIQEARRRASKNKNKFNDKILQKMKRKLRPVKKKRRKKKK